MKNESNPSLFRKLSEPHESLEKLDAAMTAFMEEVAAAREKHQLQNVVILISSPGMADGEEQNFVASISLGDELKVPLMLAQALGDSQSALEKKIDALKSGRGRSR